MKYKLDKKILWINLLSILLLIGSTIYTEGIEVITKKTEITTCPENAFSKCPIINDEGETYYMEKGEVITTNKFNKKKLDTTNYGVWALITLSLLTNHLIHNRKYRIKKQLKKLYNKIKEIKIDDIDN